MTEKLKDYQPSFPEYVLSDAVREEFPLELNFADATSCEPLAYKKDCMKFVGKSFAVTFPDVYVARKMDNYEKSVLRGEYCTLVENTLPERKRQLEAALEEAKRLKKEAEELYSSTLQEINSMAAEVKEGVVEFLLKGNDTFCIALAGYYLYYTWNDGSNSFILAKATPANDASLWSSDEKNREAMKQIFGIEFPEDEKEEQADDTGDF